MPVSNEPQPEFLTQFLDNLFLRTPSKQPKRVPFTVDTDELPVLLDALTAHADALGRIAVETDGTTSSDQARIDQAHATLLALRVKRITEIDEVLVGDDPDYGPTLKYWVDIKTERKISCIKAVRDVLLTSLKEAKDMVESGSIGPFNSVRAAEKMSAKLMAHCESLKVAQR